MGKKKKKNKNKISEEKERKISPRMKRILEKIKHDFETYEKEKADMDAGKEGATIHIE